MPDGAGFTVTELPAEEEGKRGPPQRDRIVAAILKAGLTFWCDREGKGYASWEHDGRIERHPIRSQRFKLIVRGIYGEQGKRVIEGQMVPGSIADTAMRETLPVFEAMALRNPIGRNADVRLTGVGEDVWLDLGDDDWALVRVAADGWRLVAGAHVPLIRPDGMRALPVPARDPGAMASLRKLLNLAAGDAADADFRLIVAWLVAALHPSGPYTLLALDGEQGSGKSTAAKMLRRLVDPNRAEHRAPPRKEDDLLIAAQNGRVVAIDNVSFIETDMADALCRLATGAGFSKRALYTDAAEVIVSVARPLLLNGIPSLLARGDLADRALAITLPPIPDERRRPEREVWADFDRASPGILAALLDGLARALRYDPPLQLPRLPRMADFARLACAAAPAFGWTVDEMLVAIEGNREAAVSTMIESDPLAGAIQALAADNPAGWRDSATLLLEVANLRVPIEVKNERGWPKDGARLSGRLKRVAPALRRAGVEVIMPAGGGRAGRVISITLKGGEKQGSELSERSLTGRFD